MLKMSNTNLKKVFPGLKLGSLVDYKPSDKNTYVYFGSIYSSVKGYASYEGDQIHVITD